MAGKTDNVNTRGKISDIVKNRDLEDLGTRVREGGDVSLEWLLEVADVHF